MSDVIKFPKKRKPKSKAKLEHASHQDNVIALPSKPKPRIQWDYSLPVHLLGAVMEAGQEHEAIGGFEHEGEYFVTINVNRLCGNGVAAQMCRAARLPSN